MKIFITGGEGFIGSNLIYFLASKGYEIGYCDNSFSSCENTTLLGVKKECSDISEVDVGILRKYDALIHLAAVKKHNALTDKEIKLLYQTNFQNTARLFEMAGLAGINNILFSSSLYAHGNLHKFMVSEEDPPHPLSLYGQSKLYGELALEEAYIRHNFNATAFRLYFIYGPKQYSGKGYPSVFLKSFDRLRLGQSPIIINDGMQRLDYLYIDDLCELFLAALISPVAGFNIFNASSAKAVTIKSIVELITHSWNKKFDTNYCPIYSGEDFTKNTYRSGSNLKAFSAWGWSPRINHDIGVNNMIDWFVDKMIE